MTKPLLVNLGMPVTNQSTQAGKVPRRSVSTLQTQAEQSISKAMGEVTQLGVDPRVSRALDYLLQARDLVSDITDDRLSSVIKPD